MWPIIYEAGVVQVLIKLSYIFGPRNIQACKLILEAFSFFIGKDDIFCFSFFDECTATRENKQKIDVKGGKVVDRAQHYKLVNPMEGRVLSKKEDNFLSHNRTGHVITC
jgi:hypothetical protein